MDFSCGLDTLTALNIRIMSTFRLITGRFGIALIQGRKNLLLVSENFLQQHPIGSIV